MNKKKNIWIITFLAPTVILFLLIYMGSLIIAIASSFTKWNGMTAMQFVGIDNYVNIFKDPVFRASLWHTLIWAFLALAIHVPFGVMVALVLRRRRKGWKFVRASFMLPNIISKAALTLMFVFIFKPDVGVLNTVLRNVGLDKLTTNWLVNPSTAFFSVTNIWLWYAAVITLITLSEMMSISSELAEAARVDGASEWQIDFKIYLPLLRRIIGTSSVIAITAVFKEFESIYMTTNGGPGNSTMTVSVMMVNKIVQSNQYGYANALGVLLLVMGVVAMLVCNKIFSMDKADY
jgi:ABC-type sugar transport systems, permease components